MGRRLISCVILAVVLTACQPASVSASSNIVSATNTTNATSYPMMCMVVANSLHVREGPGVEYPVIDYLHYGTIVEVTAQV